MVLKGVRVKARPSGLPEIQNGEGVSDVGQRALLTKTRGWGYWPLTKRQRFLQ